MKPKSINNKKINSFQFLSQIDTLKPNLNLSKKEEQNMMVIPLATIMDVVDKLRIRIRELEDHIVSLKHELFESHKSLTKRKD